MPTISNVTAFQKYSIIIKNKGGSSLLCAPTKVFVGWNDGTATNVTVEDGACMGGATDGCGNGKIVAGDFDWITQGAGATGLRKITIPYGGCAGNPDSHCPWVPATDSTIVNISHYQTPDYRDILVSMTDIITAGNYISETPSEEEGGWSFTGVVGLFVIQGNDFYLPEAWINGDAYWYFEAQHQNIRAVHGTPVATLPNTPHTVVAGGYDGHVHCAVSGEVKEWAGAVAGPIHFFTLNNDGTDSIEFTTASNTDGLTYSTDYMSSPGSYSYENVEYDYTVNLQGDTPTGSNYLTITRGTPTSWTYTHDFGAVMDPATLDTSKANGATAVWIDSSHLKITKTFYNAGDECSYIRFDCKELIP
jgi:hypothetical protein